MIPTTPNGTRSWRSSSPLGRVEPRTTSPTGSGSAAVCRSPSAMPAIRSAVRVSRSIRAVAVPAARAAATSASFPASTSGVPATSASAIASSAWSLTARVAVTRSFAAVRARRAASATEMSLTRSIYPPHGAVSERDGR